MQSEQTAQTQTNFHVNGWAAGPCKLKIPRQIFRMKSPGHRSVPSSAASWPRAWLSSDHLPLETAQQARPRLALELMSMSGSDRCLGSLPARRRYEPFLRESVKQRVLREPEQAAAVQIHGVEVVPGTFGCIQVVASGGESNLRPQSGHVDYERIGVVSHCVGQLRSARSI